MRTGSWLVVCLAVAGCSQTSSDNDAGGDAGTGSDAGTGWDAGTGTDGGPTCTPASTSCTELSNAMYFSACPERVEDVPARFCPPIYGTYREDCSDGTKWTHGWGGLGPFVTCVYVDGGLVGGQWMLDIPPGWVAGHWQLENCQSRIDACADAGTCGAVPDGGTCVSLLGTWCPWTEEGERQNLCAFDAGTWTASACADGGMLGEMRYDQGYEFTCAYLDGKLVGGTQRMDGGTASYGGQWQLDGCTAQPQTAICP